MGRRAARRHRGSGHRQDPGHRRARPVSPRDPRRVRLDGGRRPDPRRARTSRCALRGPAGPGTGPRPDLQRQGGPGAVGAPGGRPRSGGPGASARLELPQLLPPGPDRTRRRGRAPGPAGRPRRGRPAPPPARPVAGPAADLPLEPGRRRGLVAGPVRRVHQPGQGRARHAGPGRRVRRLRGCRLRGRVRPGRAGDRATAWPRQPRAGTRGAQGLRPLPGGRAGPGGTSVRARADRRGCPKDRRQGGPTDRRRHRFRPEHQALHARRAGRDRGARRHLRGRRSSPRGPPVPRAGPRLPGLPGRAGAARSARLRGADRRGHRSLPGPAQRPAALPAPVSLPAGRRVPGRERRPDRARGDARADARPARQRDGRGRRRPVDLPLPGRQLRRLRRVRPPVRPGPDPRSGRHAAGTADPPPARGEPPFRWARPDGRQPDHRAERDALRAGQAPRHQARRRAAGGADRLRRPGRRGGHDRRPDPGPDDRAFERRRAPCDGRRRGPRRWCRPRPALVGHRDPLPQAQAPRGDRRPAPRRGHPVHGGRRAVALRDARDPRPRADPPGDRRSAPGHRPRADALGGAVAARRARDPGGRPDGPLRPAPPHRGDPRGRRVGPGRRRPDRWGRARSGATAPSRTRRTGTTRAGRASSRGRSTSWPMARSR